MHHMCVFSTDFCMLLMSCSRVILHVIKMTYQSTRIMQVNLVNGSVTVNIHCKQEPQDVALHKPYLKVLYNMYALLLMDLMIILMDSFNITMLSMEPRKHIITLYNKYCLTSYSISCGHIT